MQDSFLPHVEDGTIVLIGATTENPSFQVNNALLSRCQVITLEKLNVEEIQTILRRALREIGATMTTDPQHSGADSESDGCGIQLFQQTDFALLSLSFFGRSAIFCFLGSLQACRPDRT